MKIKATLESEKRFWNNEVSLNAESELKKPHRTSWEYQYWQVIFESLKMNYDFNEKNIFVGGCGTGIFEEWILKNYSPKSISSVDLSEEMIKLAKIRLKNNPKVKFYICNLEHLPFNKEEFNVAVIIDALHHVPNEILVINEAFF